MTTDSKLPKELPRGAAIYRIRVAGALDDNWSDRTGGMKVIVHAGTGEGRTTDLLGALPDQAALMGVLDRLYSHGTQLLEVECLELAGAADELVVVKNREVER